MDDFPGKTHAYYFTDCSFRVPGNVFECNIKYFKTELRLESGEYLEFHSVPFGLFNQVKKEAIFF